MAGLDQGTTLKNIGPVIALAHDGPSVLACGAWLKNTVCLSKGHQAFMSCLIGDLGTATARLQLEQAVACLCDELRVQPQLVLHDKHPDFYSSQFAQHFATQRNIPVLAVQHHHAHIAAICAEHHITQPVLGLALDGVGLGDDNTAWGGELLWVNGAQYQRLGHLAQLFLPGGDRAAEQPWRMAASALYQMGRADEITRRFAHQPAAATVLMLLQRQLNCPVSSSMGRLFDVAAGLLGVCEIQAFEAQAAIGLQQLAEQHGAVPAMVDGYQIHNGILDFSPLLQQLAEINNAAYGAALFHATVIAGLAQWVLIYVAQHQIKHIALGGGCFHNAILLQGLQQVFSRAGLQVLTSQQLAPNDSAIALGQAWVGVNWLERR